MENVWQIAVDMGGTFTDCLAKSPDGKQHVFKVLSSAALCGKIEKVLSGSEFIASNEWPVKADIFQNYSLQIEDSGASANVTSWDPKTNRMRLGNELKLKKGALFMLSSGEVAPILACRIATGTPLHQALPPIALRLGTTKGTNALLERKGAKTALVVTKGFGDLLTIGTQQRPDLFALNIRKPQPLHTQTFEVDERISASGTVLTALNEAECVSLAQKIQASGCTTVAVSFLHAYLQRQHELLLKNELQRLGIGYVSASHQLYPGLHYLRRTQTTVINAYLDPVLHAYFEGIGSQLKAGDMRIMTSAGGLTSREEYVAKDSLLSGPAGGAIAATGLGRHYGFERLLTFDMGGTSTDCSRIDGAPEKKYVTRVGDAELQSPAIAIETVAAGGGSICSVDNGVLKVGPESAGAEPGPACYGRGGPLTITDVDLLLHKLNPDGFSIPLDISASEKQLTKILKMLRQYGVETTSQEVLRGFEQIADEKMAHAIRKTSVARGYDPADHALLAFGGAGGVHACHIAELLEIRTILFPFQAGILSAYGIAVAEVERFKFQQVLLPLDQCQHNLPKLFSDLANVAIDELASENVPRKSIYIKSQILTLRLQQQTFALDQEFGDLDSIVEKFLQEYQRIFGYQPSDPQIEVEGIKAFVASQSPHPAGRKKSATTHSVRVIPGTEQNVKWCPGMHPTILAGPCNIQSPTASFYLARGWELEIIDDEMAIATQKVRNGLPDPQMGLAAELELFINRLTAIAEEMGSQLQRTAMSVNVRERLDFSCAILDHNGALIVNAAHIPVHLGSLGVCARLLLANHSPGPGDVLITNHPRFGGSHLPDITLLAGIYNSDQECVAYVINRAHHAEIGGIAPGSTPPHASNLAEEGVVIAPFYLVKNGLPQWQELTNLLMSHRYPTRALHENIADINAALASLQSGLKEIEKLVQTTGTKAFSNLCDRILGLGESALQNALGRLPLSAISATEYLDDGTQICVNMMRNMDGVVIDFTGTSATQPGNLWANKSIVYSAVIYVLRLLCAKPVPLNEGLLKAVDIRLPECFLNPAFPEDPWHCPPVVGGNTETSQRLVDTLLKALQLCSGGQGTMNNVVFGNADFGYYETLCGGSGAGPGFDGCDAVHQHMTNTRITDCEELERHYPVRLHRFACRHASGGTGQYRGGNGVIRELEFLQSMTLSIVSQHRIEVPFSLAGGGHGAVGEQYLRRANGVRETLKGIDQVEVWPGDRFVIKTPGGSGYGKLEDHA